MIEIEVKFPVKDVNKLKRKLTEIGAIKLHSQIEEDIYFQHPTIDFSITDEALRLRKINGEYTLTYKGSKLDKTTKTREEINVRVDDGDSFKEILIRMKFKPFMEVTKTRDIYSLNEIHIYLDNVNSLGYFVELEKIVSNQKELEEEKRKIFETVKKLGLSEKNSIRKSYLELLLEKSSSMRW
ncbi:MAG: class IV adenylate cyclase [Candidatus Odinarchaeia archaeon]